MKPLDGLFDISVELFHFVGSQRLKEVVHIVGCCLCEVNDEWQVLVRVERILLEVSIPAGLAKHF